MKQKLIAVLFANLISVAAMPVAASELLIHPISTYQEDCPDEGCAEISAFDSASSRLFVTNAEENELRILDVAADGTLREQGVVDLSVYGGGPNSVAVSNQWPLPFAVVVVAIEADDKTEAGKVVGFNSDGDYLGEVNVGALPDMLTFTPDGRYLLVANEGEPNDAYTVDPEGSVTVVDIAKMVEGQVDAIKTADFTAFNQASLKDVRVFGLNASVAQDLEPEYIAVDANSQTAWISLQENNALAKLDIASATITGVYGLGYKKHGQSKNGFDASNKDDAINIQSWPTLGMYMPDAIASYQRGKATFIISANEGDARDYGGYSEEARVKDLTLDAEAFPDAAVLQTDENLGRLKTTTAHGDLDGDGDHDVIYSYGARSFSIWNANGKQVYDSGSEFEQRLAMLQEQGVDVWVDKRSDDKGPEPESVIVGELAGEHYAFIGLERVSGVFVYRISDPQKPEFVYYLDLKAEGGEAPEGMTFIKRDQNVGWLVVSNEGSNTTTLYQVMHD